MKDEKELDALALATSIFAAGFFLGIGTGILLSHPTGARTRERLKSAVDDLLDDAAKALRGFIQPERSLIQEETRDSKES